jgi:hypothetical protein
MHASFKFNLVFENQFSFSSHMFSFMTVITACSCSIHYVLKMQSSTMWLLYDSLKLGPRIEGELKSCCLRYKNHFPNLRDLTWMGDPSQKNGTFHFCWAPKFGSVWEGGCWLPNIWNVLKWQNMWTLSEMFCLLLNLLQPWILDPKP